MDKEEILKEIKKTEEHLATMKKLLEDCEYSRWNPKPSDEYYCVDDGNDVRRVNFNIMNAYDRDRIKTYNCFRTKEQALDEIEDIADDYNRVEKTSQYYRDGFDEIQDIIDKVKE